MTEKIISANEKFIKERLEEAKQFGKEDELRDMYREIEKLVINGTNNFENYIAENVSRLFNEGYSENAAHLIVDSVFSSIGGTLLLNRDDIDTVINNLKIMDKNMKNMDK